MRSPAEIRRDLAHRLSFAAVAAVSLGARAPVVAGPAPARLSRTHRRALRLVSGQTGATGDLAARGVGGRNACRRTARACPGGALSRARTAAHANDAHRAGDGAAAFRRQEDSLELDLDIDSLGRVELASRL